MEVLKLQDTSRIKLTMITKEILEDHNHPDWWGKREFNPDVNIESFTGHEDWTDGPLLNFTSQSGMARFKSR